MKKFFRHCKGAAAADRWAEARFSCASSRRAVLLLDAILLASISVLLAVELAIEIAEILAVCLLVRRTSKTPLKAVSPAL